MQVLRLHCRLTLWDKLTASFLYSHIHSTSGPRCVGVCPQRLSLRPQLGVLQFNSATNQRWNRPHKTPGTSCGSPGHPHFCPPWPQIRGSHDALPGFTNLLEGAREDSLLTIVDLLQRIFERIHTNRQMKRQTGEVWKDPEHRSFCPLWSWRASPSRHGDTLTDLAALQTPYFRDCYGGFMAEARSIVN